MNGFTGAVTFLTRVPVPGSAVGDDPQGLLARSVPWFGVVGALVGLATAAVYGLVRLGLPPFPAAVVAVAVAVMLTGAFHEDGLADTFDALWGGFDRERRLAILKDSRHGTYGVSALVLALTLRVGLLASLGPGAALGALVAAGAVGRVAAVLLMATTPPARIDGLAAAYVHDLGPTAVMAGVLCGLGPATAMVGAWAAGALVVAVAAVVVVRRVAMVKIGGIVGDVLGAVEQVAELGVLALLVVVRFRGWPLAGWWTP